MQPQAEPTPYVGSRPFERTEDDRRRFFGRDAEIDEIVAHVLAHNLLLVYAVSGAGKTSVLNAGVIPKLVAEGFEVLPRGRVGVSVPGLDVDQQRNPYVVNLLCSLSPERDAASLIQLPLADYLRALPQPEGSAGRVLVIDQAEELFTFLPRNWQQLQKEFFRALRDAVRDSPDLRVVIVTREDYLARFDDLAPLLPGGLRMRLHFEPLSCESARLAVEGPLAGTRWRFDDGVAQRIVSDLSKMKLATGTGGVREEPGPYVEPVQLQIVCSALWDKLPEGVDVITAAHLRRFGDVEETLERFYEETIEACTQALGCDKERLARWFGEELITPSDTRGQVFRGEVDTKGLPNTVVAFFEARHLLHADERASGRWYELTHDRLVRPIRTVTERWTKQFDVSRARRRMRRQVLLGVAVLGVAVAAIKLVDVVMAPRLEAKKTEEEITGRIRKLYLDCFWAPAECEPKKVRVFDFVADHYLRQGNAEKLAKLLKSQADLIPADYGMPAITSVPIGDHDESSALRIEYHPDHKFDEWRLRSEWARMAESLGEEWGLPTTPRITLIADDQVPVSFIHIVARPMSCSEPAVSPNASSFAQIPASERAVISQKDIAKDERLQKFFDDYRAREHWEEYQELELGGPWWFVPAWTLPVWHVGGHPAVSPEHILAVVAANEIRHRPDLVLSCDALKVILQRVSTHLAVTVREAVAARTLEGVRLVLLGLVPDPKRGLWSAPVLLDRLASHPDMAAREAAELAERDRSERLDESSPLHGPWQNRVAFDTTTYTLSATAQELARQLPAERPAEKHPIRVELGPSIAQVIAKNSVLNEDIVQRLQDMQRKLYLRYGVEAPGVWFTSSETKGFRIEMLDRDGSDPDAIVAEVTRDVAAERIVHALETRYEDTRRWWITAETVFATLARMPPEPRHWLERHYSVTDLKRVMRAVVTADDVADESNTLRDVPWLLESLTFWSQAVDPRSVRALSHALRSTQRARLHPSGLTVHVDVNVEENVDTGVPISVAASVHNGLRALDRGRLDDAESQFAAALRVDRGAAIDAFLALYPARSSLAPERRTRRLLAACKLPLPGKMSAAPDAITEYEVLDVLANGRATLSPAKQWRLDLCMLWSTAERGKQPDEVRRRLSSLLADASAATSTTNEAFFLAHRWLVSHKTEMAPPSTEVVAVRSLLTRSLMDLEDKAAFSVWEMTLVADLRDSPSAWVRDLNADVETDIVSSRPILAQDMIRWLNSFGQADAEHALALADGIVPGHTPLDRWRIAWLRTNILLHLGHYGDLAQRAHRLSDASALLVALIPNAPDPHWAGVASAALLETLFLAGDNQRAREATRVGIARSNDPALFDQSTFWIEVGEGDMTRASQIAARMVARAHDDVETLFVDGILAILTRRANFEASARAFIFHDKANPHHDVDYVRLMLYWSLAEGGREADAKRLLDDRMASIHPDTWPARLQQRDSMVWREMLVAVFAGVVPESRILEQLRDDASFHASGLDQTALALDGMRCEAYFYLALRERVTGDPVTRDARFRNKLERVIETKYYGFVEFRMAKYLLSIKGT